MKAWFIVSAMAASWLLNMFAEHMLNYCKSCSLHFSEIKSINRREAASKSVYLWHITKAFTACNRRVWGHNKKSFMKAHKSFEPEVLFADDMHFSLFSFSARTSPAIIHQHSDSRNGKLMMMAGNSSEFWKLKFSTSIDSLLSQATTCDWQAFLDKRLAFRELILKWMEMREL